MLTAIAHRILRRLRDESGQSVVEFALVVPLLCGLIVALVDVGFGVNDAVDATHLANQGARLAAVNANPTGGIAAYILTQASSKDVKVATVCIKSSKGAAANIGDDVTVIVHTNFKIVTFISGATFL